MDAHNDFEKKLRDLKLKQPSSELRKKIFDRREVYKVSESRIKKLFDFRISLAWAAVLAIIFGIAGFWFADMLYKKTDSVQYIEKDKVKVQIIYENPGAKNVLDFTNPSQDLIPGKPNLEIEINKEA